MASSRLTVYFEDPFWVGLYEREDGGRYEVSRIVFGAEPKDYEVYAFLLARRTRSRRQREEEKERQFALREEKRREKHKGH